jgi:uncharacterized protein YcnI
MTPLNRVLFRGFATVFSGVAMTFGSIVGAGSASAHVHADADDPVRGEDAVVTFRVPDESDTGSPTTKLIVNLPGLTSVSTEAIPGWTNSLERDTAAGTVRSITWSANPGSSGILPDQFAVFAVSVELPDTDSVTFPVTQVYADGTTVHWDDAPLPNGAEPEHPAPKLDLLPTEQGHGARRLLADHEPGSFSRAALADVAKLGPDNVARALAGTALLVAAIGVGISVMRRRG